jgi:hypothetical protein
MYLTPDWVLSGTNGALTNIGMGRLLVELFMIIATVLERKPRVVSVSVLHEIQERSWSNPVFQTPGDS